MKKIRILTVAVLVGILGTFSVARAEKDVFIGISKFGTQPALDAAEQGIQDGVKERFPNARFDLQNAEFDMSFKKSKIQSITERFISEKVDIAVGIATLTAQDLAWTIKDRPVLFCAVENPKKANLVPSEFSGESLSKHLEKWVTGISNMSPIREYILLLNRITQVKTLGYIYNSDDDHSTSQAMVVKDACKELGIKFVEATVNDPSKVRQAVQTIATGVDAIYLGNDYIVSMAIADVTSVAMTHKVPVMSTDPDSAETSDILMVCGLDYYKMGRATGRMAADVLKGAKPADFPIRYITDPTEFDLRINMDVARKLGLNVPEGMVSTANKIIKDGKLTSK